MNLKEIITGRRSVRSYEEKPLSEEIIKNLIAMGIHAPSGSNMQPWAFVVIEDKEFMREWSDRTKEVLLGQMESNAYLQQYKGLMENKNFNIFYDAPCLLLIYGDTKSPNHVFDCSMAAQNIMLSAYEMGLGSCWIGFAMTLGNSPEIKNKLGVPENYRLVAPLVLGYPRGTWPPIPRREPVIFAWKK
ncbi:nitroreductase family protein [Desulfallas sp. Bu1-1]|uniref:nitroreductase family protein n=1 Tax=Desulfallas sp. Bu1-1 TaxID=2787620 RepID=UPI00189D7E9C|nr:nitroreductase family protein [Desulfallas sp. Bu1-1]MBF7084435.1 nitroreductase family protein [Desulfallas sp. Bu1-1]